MPTNVPISAPRTASFVAPTRFAPSAVAAKSITNEMIVSNPSTTSAIHDTRSKSSAQAASSRPAKTSGTPGSAGRTEPATPMQTSTTASTSHNVSTDIEDSGVALGDASLQVRRGRVTRPAAAGLRAVDCTAAA